MIAKLKNYGRYLRQQKILVEIVAHQDCERSCSTQPKLSISFNKGGKMNENCLLKTLAP